MTRRPRPLLLPSTPRVARAVLGGVLFGVIVQGSAFAQGTNTLQVHPGDTASALALPLVPDGATLDQMLVALLRANPEAFIDGNVNLLRAGQSLQVPETTQVLRTSAEQARETVLDHHSRFREYVQRLAERAHALPDGPAREISGKVIEPSAERGGQGTGQDRLMLTKDLQDAQALKVALEKQTQEAMAHLAALQKNIEQLQRLSQNPQASAAQPALPASTTASAVPAWAWLAGLLAAALVLLIGWRHRAAAARKTTPVTPPAVAVPPQLAGISLDLDSPADGSGTDRRP